MSRFAPVSAPEESVTLYWIRTNSGGSDNAAIQATALDTDYRLQLSFDQKPEQQTIPSAGPINICTHFLSTLLSNQAESKPSPHFKYPIITFTN